MLTIDLRTYDEVLADIGKDETRSIMLGNGFSIACHKEFNYARLLDLADFGGASRRIHKAFKRLSTADFELVVESLREAESVLGLYGSFTRTRRRMKRDAERIQDALAEAISDVHPGRIDEVGDDSLDQCRDFLREYDEVFTLNYDVLLYWAILRSRGHFQDGFRRVGHELVHQRADQQNVSWLHGALHFRERVVAGRPTETTKLEWDRDTIVDGVRKNLRRGDFPLVVMEGTWKEKQRRINRSSYLSACFQRLRYLSGVLVTLGWAFSTNDKHILSALERSDITQMFVGLFGDPANASNSEVIGTASAFENRTGVPVEYWDVSTATVW